MLIAGFTTAYDRSSNKAYERALHAEPRSSLYEPIDTDGNVGTSYDSLDRLRQYQRGILSSAGGIDAAGGGSITTPIALPGSNTTRSYNLDGLGNWKQTAYGLVDGGGTPTLNTETRAHNYLNQITTDRLAVTGGGTTTTPFAYDHGNNASSGDPNVQRRGNGNLVNDGVCIYTYDALNRVVQVNSAASPETVWAAYTYDAFGRRMSKVVSNGGLPGDSTLNGTTVFGYDGWRVVEDSDGAGTALRQYVWGRYIDELIQMRTISGAVDQYLLSDLLYRAVALTDSSGNIVEAYDTDAYGNTICFSVAGGGGTDWWADDATQTTNPKCCYIFTGQRFDPETGNYYYKGRYYGPRSGRFLSRDLIDYGGGMNMYQYVESMSTSQVDSLGLEGLVYDPTSCTSGVLPPYTPPTGHYDLKIYMSIHTGTKEAQREADSNCIYFVIYKSGSGSMIFGHASFGTDPNTLYGFHGEGFKEDLIYDPKTGSLTGGTMKTDPISSRYKCCCMSKDDMAEAQKRIDAVKDKIAASDKTDMSGQTYSLQLLQIGLQGIADSHHQPMPWDPPLPSDLESPLSTCSGAAADFGHGLGCSPIKRKSGGSPGMLEDTLAENKKCSKY